MREAGSGTHPDLGPCETHPSCPAVRSTDRASVVITGSQLDSETLVRLNLAPDENAVEIPIAVYLSGAAGLEEWR